MTRETIRQKKAFLKDRLKFLFDDDDETIFKILEHNNIYDLSYLRTQSDSDLQALKDSDNATIHNSIVVKLRTLRRYIKYQRYLGKKNDINFRINKEFYQNIDIADWYDFFGTPWSFASSEERAEELLMKLDSTSGTTPAGSTTAHSHQSLDIVQDFTRGIKRDQSLFPKLKDEAKF